MSLADSRFRTYVPQRSPELRLVCFPHAGGAASFYRSWVELLPDHVELAIAMYPGRENRLPDPHPDALEGLAADLAARVPQDVPLVLFGHSMGAAVAFEVARRLARPPERLIVSGQPAPHRQRHSDMHLRTDDALLAELRAVGSATAGLLDHPEVRKLMLPVIRADYRLIERYRPGPLAPLPIPITALIGRAAPEVDEDEARAWERCTAAGFELHTVDGGHFHFVENQRAFAEWLTALLATVDPLALSERNAR